MYRPERQPAWQKNLVWGSAIIVVLATIFSLAVWPFARLASEKHGPTLLHMATAHVLQQHNGTIGVQAATDYEPGQPLALVAGSEIVFNPAEVPQLTVQTAIQNGAAALTEALFRAGAAPTLALVERSSLAASVQRALEGPLTALLASTFGDELFAAGMAAGNRLADWQAQQAANPGAPVQPLVGVFVQVPPEQLAGKTAANIGTIVVQELTNVLIASGHIAARELLSNEAHIAAFDRALERAQQRATDLFTVLLYGSEAEVHERLNAASLAASGTAPVVAAGGLVSERELAQLSASEQHALITKRIADEVYAHGVAQAAGYLSEPADRQALMAAQPLLLMFDSAAHDRYRSLELLGWIVGALLIFVVMINTRGAWRLVLPALLIALGIVPHLVAVNAVAALPSSIAWQPLAARTMQEGVRYAAYVSAGLLGLQVLVSLVQLVRPRRRRRYL